MATGDNITSGQMSGERSLKDINMHIKLFLQLLRSSRDRIEQENVVINEGESELLRSTGYRHGRLFYRSSRNCAEWKEWTAVQNLDSNSCKTYEVWMSKILKAVTVKYSSSGALRTAVEQKQRNSFVKTRVWILRKHNLSLLADKGDEELPKHRIDMWRGGSSNPWIRMPTSVDLCGML